MESHFRVLGMQTSCRGRHRAAPGQTLGAQNTWGDTNLHRQGHNVCPTRHGGFPGPEPETPVRKP